MVLDVLFFQYQPIVPEKGAVNVPSNFDKVAEFLSGTDPTVADSDGDNIPDGCGGTRPTPISSPLSSPSITSGKSNTTTDVAGPAAGGPRGQLAVRYDWRLPTWPEYHFRDREELMHVVADPAIRTNGKANQTDRVARSAERRRRIERSRTGNSTTTTRSTRMRNALRRGRLGDL